MSQNNPISSQQLAQLYRQAVRSGLSLDKLEKKVNKRISQSRASLEVDQRAEKERIKQMRQRLPRAIRWIAFIFPLGFIAIGLFLLGNAVFPVAKYYFADLAALTKQQLKAPIPREEVLDVTPLVVAQNQNQGSALTSQSPLSNEPVILDTELDYTNLSNWFDDERSQALEQNTTDTQYLLSIPKLEIENAAVKIGGTNLEESLIAYPGTALPGELGSPVIFGHSVLRQFYNPSQKNPRRYNSIFSYIMTLEKGDPIFLVYQGATYKYVVESNTEVKPEDTYILAQQYDGRELKLITCVPEGTYLKRGVVTAQLVAN